MRDVGRDLIPTLLRLGPDANSNLVSKPAEPGLAAAELLGLGRIGQAPGRCSIPVLDLAVFRPHDQLAVQPRCGLRRVHFVVSNQLHRFDDVADRKLPVDRVDHDTGRKLRHEGALPGIVFKLLHLRHVEPGRVGAFDLVFQSDGVLGGEELDEFPSGLGVLGEALSISGFTSMKAAGVPPSATGKGTTMVSAMTSG